MTDTWYPIPGFSLYEVNNDGVVRYKTDLTKKSLQSYKGKSIQLLAVDTNNPYYHMYSDAKQTQVTVDRKWLLKFSF